MKKGNRPSRIYPGVFLNWKVLPLKSEISRSDVLEVPAVCLAEGLIFRCLDALVRNEEWARREMIAVSCEERRGYAFQLAFRNAEEAHRGVCMCRRTGGTHSICWIQAILNSGCKSRGVSCWTVCFGWGMSWSWAFPFGAGKRPWKLVKGIDESYISVTDGHQIHGIDLLSADT